MDTQKIRPLICIWGGGASVSSALETVIRRPGFLIGIGSIAMSGMLSLAEEAVKERLGWVALIGLFFLGLGGVLYFKPPPRRETASSTGKARPLQVGLLGVLLMLPYAVLLVAIGYLQDLAQVILVVAWVWLLRDLYKASKQVRTTA